MYRFVRHYSGRVNYLRIGIPRALLFHRYHPAFERFFQELGAEVVVSPETNKTILNHGVKNAESEICLPVKVFYGHVFDLKDKCDYLFIPRIVAVETEAYTCPKFLGLPDMIAVHEELPPILAPTINLKKGKKDFHAEILKLGHTFTDDDRKIRRALRLALKALRVHERHLNRQDKRGRADQLMPVDGEAKLRIGVAGHPYNILDPFISQQLIGRLEERGVEIVIPEHVPQRKIRRAAKKAPKDLFWTYERDVLGSSYHWVKNKLVDGIIYVIAFPCGPDSTIQVMIENYAKEEGPVPLMSLVLDEHSAEAGLITRLEAFVDLLSERKLAVQGAS